MKKGWIIYWIVCAAFAGIGLILCAVGFSMGATWETVNRHAPGWVSLEETLVYSIDLDDDWTDSDGTDSSSAGSDNSANGEGTIVNEGVGKTFAKVRKIDIEADALDLRIVTKDVTEDSVDVVFLEGSKFISCYQDGDELKIENKDGWKLSDGTVEVRISVPAAHFSEIDIDIDAGSVRIDRLASVGSLNLNVDAGEIVMEEFVADEVDLECAAGRIEASGACNRSIDIECGAGEVICTVNGKKSSYNYEVECGIGEVIIDNEVFSGIGERELHSQGAAKQMNIECGMGSVVINFLQE